MKDLFGLVTKSRIDTDIITRLEFGNEIKTPYCQNQLLLESTFAEEREAEVKKKRDELWDHIEIT